MSVHIVDSGLGNVGALMSLMARLGVEAVRARRGDDLAVAQAVVLPGVGAFDRGVAALAACGLWEALARFADSGRPVLGICLGMHLMGRSSEEGKQSGLGWIDAGAVRLSPEGDDPSFRLPHMGWSEVAVECPGVLFPADLAPQRFYFAHSFALLGTGSDACTVASARHGRRFVAAFERNNLMGVQFHPEKSHRFGRGLLERFLSRVGDA